MSPDDAGSDDPVAAARDHLLASHADTIAEVLAAAVDAAGYTLPATPVPAPPYVVVTSTGPVLRGTVDDGRLLVGIDCFEVVREPPGSSASVAYALTESSPAASLSVSFESA